MFSPRPPDRIPHGVPPNQGVYLRRTNQQLEALSRFQGVAVSGGTLPTEVPPQEQWITGKLKVEEKSGSGNYSGGDFSTDPAGIGFTDDEGYLAYAFDQTYDFAPWKGDIILNGISTTLPSATTSGANYAYPLNGETWEEGANVLLKRAGNHWIIIGGLGEANGSGSGGGGMIPIYCDGVISGYVTANANSVSVTTI